MICQGICKETCGHSVPDRVDGGTLSFVHLGDEFINLLWLLVSVDICLEA